MILGNWKNSGIKFLGAGGNSKIEFYKGTFKKMILKKNWALLYKELDRKESDFIESNTEANVL